MQHHRNQPELLSPEVQECVAVFSFTEPEVARAVVAIAEEEDSPVGLCINADLVETRGIEGLSVAALSLARNATVPVAVTFSHARSLEMVRLALDLGFSSVMFDGSFLPFARNIELTARAVDMASPGIAVEGEIGAFADFGTDSSGQFLICDLAEKFSRETGIDSLAVGIASDAGGSYCLVMDLLERLRRCAPAGLSLHDASLLTPQDILGVIAAGVNKLYFGDCPGEASLGSLPSLCRDNPRFRKTVRRMLRLLGTARRRVSAFSPGID
jgi:fructose-bisphosphate aldolase class II